MNHRKIAELAHVSTSTVSKALSGSSEINAELAAEIRRIAIESGYFAERNKRKVANKRKNGENIAVVVPEIISVHYSKIVTLLKSFIDERGGMTAVYIFEFDKTTLNQLIQSLSTDNKTDGIILITSFEILKPLSVPLVCFDSCSGHKSHFSIGADMSVVIDDIVSYLKSLGHTKIGFVGELITSSKEKKFRNSLTKHGLDINENHILKIEKRFEEIGTESAKSIITCSDRPTAIVAAYDEVAVSLIYYLDKAGIKVPEDISVVGMNDIPLAPYIKPSLTTVRFDYDEQAALAVDVLYDKIYSGNDTIQHLTVDYELKIRDSVSALKKN